MALKLIGTLLGNPDTPRGRVVRIYRDFEWDNFVVRIYIHGEHYEPADYFTDDLNDAHGTGFEMLAARPR